MLLQGNWNKKKVVNRHLVMPRLQFRRYYLSFGLLKPKDSWILVLEDMVSRFLANILHITTSQSLESSRCSNWWRPCTVPPKYSTRMLDLKMSQAWSGVLKISLDLPQRRGLEMPKNSNIIQLVTIRINILMSPLTNFLIVTNQTGTVVTLWTNPRCCNLSYNHAWITSFREA